jgi:ADP-L-glycero-D-manno-heptose 6-epimerase
VATALVNAVRGTTAESALGLAELVSSGLIEYKTFPDALRGKYQCYTQADLTRLRAAGCDHRFADVQTGVSKYVHWLTNNP